MNISLYGKLLKHAEKNYSNKLITANVTVMKHTKSYLAQQHVKHKLFFLLSKLIIKAINNFNHLTRNISKHKILHTP